MLAIAHALGFGDTVCSALLGELRWFVQDDHLFTPLEYIEAARLELSPAMCWLDRDDVESARSCAVAEGDTDAVAAYDLWDAAPKPSSDEVSKMVCDSYLAEAGIIDAPGRLSPAYNVIDAALRPYGLRIAFGGKTAMDQMRRRMIAMMALGWLARTLNFTAAEAWPLYRQIARRLPSGVQQENTAHYEKALQQVLLHRDTGDYEFTDGVAKFADCDMMQFVERDPDGSQWTRLDDERIEFPGTSSQVCHAFARAVDAAEATMLRALTPRGLREASVRAQRDDTAWEEFMHVSRDATS